MLGAKYSWHHFLGAMVVIFGLLVVVVPRLLQGSITEGTHESNGTVLLWMGVLVLSCVPAVFSNVYKEKALGEADIDVIYLNGWVAVYQFLFGIVVCIPAAYVLLSTSRLSLPALGLGWRCMSIVLCFFHNVVFRAMHPLFTSSHAGTRRT